MSVSLDQAVLKNKRKGFIMITNDIVNNIKNGDAFLLWSYLSSKTDNWIIIKSFLCEHFGWSMKKLNYLFQVLSGYKLTKMYQEKSKNGKFGKYVIEINDGENFTNFDEKTLVDKAKKRSKIIKSSRYPKNRKAVLPLSVKIPATKDCTVTKERQQLKKEWKATPSLYTHYPMSFFPDDERREFLSKAATRVNATEAELLTKFEKTYTGKYASKKSKDWQLTFEEYLNRELPKRIYEDKTGSRRRYDGQSLQN